MRLHEQIKPARCVSCSWSSPYHDVIVHYSLLVWLSLSPPCARPPWPTIQLHAQIRSTTCLAHRPLPTEMWLCTHFLYGRACCLHVLGHLGLRLHPKPARLQILRLRSAKKVAWRKGWVTHLRTTAAKAPGVRVVKLPSQHPNRALD